jgi:solute carrier family 25 carnitine/acylcarnitine transporter 20/29
MDILKQTLRNEGVLALWKGASCFNLSNATSSLLTRMVGMASPLIGIAGVNSLLFTSYQLSKRIISPFPDLSLKEIAAAGAMAGAANSVLASPGKLCVVAVTL